MPHQRRKSGHGYSENSPESRRTVAASDVNRYKRPSMGRRHTPAGGHKHGRGRRDRDQDRQGSWDDERESFPQFCMTCEKQFMSHDEKFLYCSENCRRIDQSSISAQPVSVRSYSIDQHAQYPYYAPEQTEPRDIIPRASPSRPSSIFFGTSPPASPGTTTQISSAMTALRSLNTGPPSPPSPSETGGSIWPFGRGSVSSISNSYARPSSGLFPSTYDSGYSTGAYTYDAGYSTFENRPLPSRPPGSASTRPKSIELVTPMIGR